MDIAYKIKRIKRWSSMLGFLQAFRFELLWSFRKPLIRVKVPGFRQPFSVRRNSSDISVFETIFLEQELGVYLPDSPRLIIDGGANVGFSTAFLACRFPGATIMAIEPSRENIAMLRINCQGMQNVTVIEGGLWPVSCRLRIANPGDPAWSFRCEPAPNGAVGTFAAYSIEDLIDQAGQQRCHLLKLDVEGSEEHLFSNSDNWLSRVDSILVEVHGSKAMAVINKVCPASKWEKKTLGEKMLLCSRECAS